MSSLPFSLLAAATLLMTACDAEPLPEPVAATDVRSCPPAVHPEPAVASLTCDQGRPEQAGESPYDPPACAELDARAHELITEHMTCTNDMQCDAVSTVEVLGDTCAPAFACYLPMSVLAAKPRFVAEALAIDHAYSAACGCPVPTCVDPDYTLSTCEGSCGIEVDVPEPIDDLRI